MPVGYTDEFRPCDVCGRDIMDCECPECPVCHQVGDPDCFTECGLTPPPGWKGAANG